MSAGAAAKIRCAIYTRVSTDQGLDQDFNSLDAQHEPTMVQGRVAVRQLLRSQARSWKINSDSISADVLLRDSKSNYI
jgi:hypothetical protein